MIHSILYNLIAISLLFTQEHYFLSHPAISPDGKRVAFTFAGDIWETTISGKYTRKITSDKGLEFRPKYSPDGKWLGYTTLHKGISTLFIVPVNGGKPKQLTYRSGTHFLESWSLDSETVYFSSNAENKRSIYKLGLDKHKTPKRIFNNFFNYAQDAQLDNKENIYFTTGNFANRVYTQNFMRVGYRGSLSPNIMKWNKKQNIVSQVTSEGGNNLSPRLDRNGTLYFLSDRFNNRYNLFSLKNDSVVQLTYFDESVKNFDVSHDGKTIVFEKDYLLYHLDLPTKKVTKITTQLFHSDLLDIQRTYQVKDNITYFDVNMDETKMMYIANGKLFLYTFADGRSKFVNYLPERIYKEVKWISDDTVLYIRTDKQGFKRVFRYNVSNDNEFEVSDKDTHTEFLTLNNDRSKAYFYSGHSDIKTYDVASDIVSHVLTESIWAWNRNPISVSGNYLSFKSIKRKEGDIFLYNLKTKELKNMTSSSIYEYKPVIFKNDIYFYSCFRENGLFNYVSVTPELYKLPLNGMGKIEKVSSGQGVYKDIFAFKDHLLVTINNQLHSLDQNKQIKGLKKPRLYSVTKHLYALEGGSVYKIDFKENSATKVDINHQFEYTIREDIRATFDMFYADYVEKAPTLDLEQWKKLYEAYAPLLDKAHTQDDIYTFTGDMLGKLNLSHTWFLTWGKEEYPERHYHYKLGLRFRGNQVTEVLDGFPALEKGVQIGDELLAVNHKQVDKDENIYKYLSYPFKTKDVILKVRRKNKVHEITVPANYSHMKKMEEYEVNKAQKIVDKKSNKRIAYIRIFETMGDDAKQFIEEVYTEFHSREALIIDFRNNSGGNRHDKMLESLRTRQQYGLWKRRGYEMKEPGRTEKKPIVLLINEESVSDAETFASAFKELNLGTVIGTTTYGYRTFMDKFYGLSNTSYSVPLASIYSLDGEYLDMVGVKPDIHVETTFDDRNKGKDPQLDYAINFLLKKLSQTASVSLPKKGH